MKRYRHNASVIEELDKVINLLRGKKRLSENYRNHPLDGEYSGMLECNVKPDTLLIYWIDEKEKILNLERIGSHSELF